MWASPWRSSETPARPTDPLRPRPAHRPLPTLRWWSRAFPRPLPTGCTTCVGGSGGRRGGARSCSECPPGGRVLAAGPPLNGSADGLVLSPVVRKLLNEHGLDPSRVQGTGLGGRITRGDVEAVIADGGTGTVPDPSAAPARVPSIADRRGPTTTVSASAPVAAACRRSRRRIGAPPGPDRPRRSGPVHQHPASNGRAHGAVQGHLRPHPDGQGDRLRTGGAGTTGPWRTVQGRRGLQPHLPALRLVGHGRGAGRVPPPQRLGGRGRT